MQTLVYGGQLVHVVYTGATLRLKLIKVDWNVQLGQNRRARIPRSLPESTAKSPGHDKTVQIHLPRRSFHRAGPAEDIVVLCRRTTSASACPLFSTLHNLQSKY